MVLNLRKEPGALFDLIFVFSAKLNPEENWMYDLVLGPKDKESMRLIRRQLAKAPKIPQELQIFAHFKENTKESFLNVLRNQYILKRNMERGSVARYREQLCAENLHHAVWRFYFACDFPESEIERGKIIDKAFYKWELRYLMFSYFSRPEEYQKKLLKAWDEVQAYYDLIYQKRAEDVTACLQLLEERDLQLIVAKLTQGPVAFERVKWAWVSVSIFNPHMVWVDAKEGTLLLGWRYERENLESLSVSDENVLAFFEVMGSLQRRKILLFLTRREWVSTKEVVEELGIQEGPTVRHLMQIRKIKLLKTKRQGREKLYRLDKEQFGKYLEQAGELFVKRKNEDLEDEDFGLK
jgi:DNA-binding transcriptional ArsR family regulator